MNRLTLRMEPRSEKVVTSTWHRVWFTGLLAALSFVLVVGPMLAVEERGALQVVGICFTVLVYLTAIGGGWAIALPRRGRLVVIQDTTRGVVMLPSWRPLVLAVVIGFVTFAVLVVAISWGFLQGTIAGRDSRWLLAMVVVSPGLVPHAVRFLRNGARVGIELSSTSMRYRSAFADETIDWRSIQSVELVAVPRVRIRVRRDGSTFDLVSGLFDSDPRLIVDLLRAVRQHPKILDDPDRSDVESLLTK